MRTSPHPFTLRQLQYVVAVADQLSFRAAATMVAVSQSSLSAQIQEVESQLGVVLFRRDKRHVAVTPAGEDFVAAARALLRSADQLADAGVKLADPMAGPFRFGVIPTIAPGVVGAVSATLRERFPQMVPRFREAQTHVLLDELSSHAVDVALVAQTDETDAHDRFSTAIVGDDGFWMACAADHALAGASDVDTAELADAGLLLLEDGHCLRDHALSACGTDAHVDHDFKATSLETLLSLVAAGRGVTLLPQCLVDNARRRQDLALVPLRRPEHRTLVLLWSKDSAHNDAYVRCAEAISAALRPLLAMR